jgi:MarR family transcriptional regulator for hemolysin
LSVSPDPSIDFGGTLYRVVRAWRREVDQNVCIFGLTEATWRPSFHLGRLGDGVRQIDLARTLGVEAPPLVRLLDVLERNGLIARTEDANDRRSRLLHMTREGLSLYRSVVQVYRRVSASLLRDVGEDELSLCHSVIERIERAMVACGDGDRGRT